MNLRVTRMKRTGARVASPALLIFAACVAAAAQSQADSKDADEPDFIVPARPTASNPAEFRAQAVVRREDAHGPGFALAYYLKLPTAGAREGLGTGRFDHYLLALLSKKTVDKKTTLDFNAVYLNAGR